MELVTGLLGIRLSLGMLVKDAGPGLDQTMHQSHTHALRCLLPSYRGWGCPANY